jgi:glutamate racemase
MSDRPIILVFDSGLGGLTVFAEVRALLPHADLIYAADDAAFPYGARSEAEVIWRVEEILQRLIEDLRPDLICIACNTASTVTLKPLRSRFPHVPFVGTVPAIKPAAQISRSRMIAVLATPGTVAREYTRELVRDYAADCHVELVGSRRLASLAESFMQGETIEDRDIALEIAPCFKSLGERRTDTIVLACTHYPLLSEQFRRLAPWPVEWIDPAGAIARRVGQVLTERGLYQNAAHVPGPFPALFSSGRTIPSTLAHALRQRGLIAKKAISIEELPSCHAMDALEPPKAREPREG